MTAPDMTLAERLARFAEYEERPGIRGVMEQAASALAAVTAERDQARQMLADAPHGESCVANVWTDDEQSFDARPCDCWKAGV